VKINTNKLYLILILSFASHVAVAMDTSAQEKICIDIGFKPKTEKFGSCVIELMSRKQSEQKVDIGDGTEDDVTCRSYGFKPGTINYSDCRMKIDSARKQLANEQARYNAELAQYEKRLKEIEDHRERQEMSKTMNIFFGLATNQFTLEEVGRSSLGLPPKPLPAPNKEPNWLTQTIILPGGRNIHCSTTGSHTTCR
jgi:hypothetical protein